jgi:hypothetical protein
MCIRDRNDLSASLNPGSVSYVVSWSLRFPGWTLSPSMPMPPLRGSWIRSSRGLNSAATKLHAASARPGKPSVDAFPDDATFELGEYAKHLKHCLARGGRGVEALLV